MKIAGGDLSDVPPIDQFRFSKPSNIGPFTWDARNGEDRGLLTRLLDTTPTTAVVVMERNSMRIIHTLALALIAVSLVLCGCGGSNVSTLQPPWGLSYTAGTATYTMGTAIIANNPTSNGGAVTGYSVSPALPAGLSLSTSTGVVSGTPTALMAKARYTVTASNAAGSSAATLAITVNDQPPSKLSYLAGTPDYVQGRPIVPNSPTSSGGAVTAYSVMPALPAGLTLSTSSGIISGTPTATRANTNYTVTASNSGGSTTATLNICVTAPVPALSADNINLIFVVSEDLAYQAAGDINPNTANLTSQGLQRALRMASFLQRDVLGMNNVTGIYALQPMSHLQTEHQYPDLVPLETVQQFAMLNQIALSDGSNPPVTANSSPILASYSSDFVPAGVAPPVFPCPKCQGLDFSDHNSDNETLVTGIITANAPGFYVFSAPWETISSLLANINLDENYQLTLPASYQGPNYIYAISIAPSGAASLVTYDSYVNPPSSYPALFPLPLVPTPCKATPFSITVTGGKGGAIIPTGINTREILYIVRHADAHPQGYWDNNNYVGAGQWRALNLPNALRGKVSPDEVYSMDPSQYGLGTVAASGDHNWSSVAPALTAEPYAIANNLPYNLVTNFLMTDPTAPQQTSDFFFTGGKFSNQNVLVAWAYQFIQPTINDLLASYNSGQTAPAWSPDDYDSIWTVKLDSVGNLTVDNSLCEGVDSARLPATPPQF